MTFKKYITEQDYKDIVFDSESTVSEKEIAAASEFIDTLVLPNIITTQEDIALYSDNIKKATAYQIEFWKENGDSRSSISGGSGDSESISLGDLSLSKSASTKTETTSSSSVSKKALEYLEKEGLLYAGTTTF